SAYYTGPTYTVAATGGGSGNSVSFASLTGSVCSVSGSVVSFIGVGSCTIAANQAGSTNYAAATEATQSFSVAKAPQTIAFSAISDRSFGNPPFAISASASSGLLVSFTASGNCTVSGNAVSLTGAGSCTIAGDQSGNIYFNPASSVVQSFSIAPAMPVIAWNPPFSIVYGSALSATQLNATATGVGGGNLVGSFSYSPPAGTLLDPGSQLLGVNFRPDDQTNYTGGAKSVSIAVLYNTAVGHMFLQPINPPTQPMSVFKLGSTIPVKFQLFLADGVTAVSTAVATIRVNKVSNGVPSTVNESVLSTVPNQGTTFRYDAASQQYIFNLGTTGWTAGSYQITALLDDGSSITISVGTR
ncbi:MAG TPA: PxKF domain-containing protein, partial [Gemmatimonadales bacterium]|nr:PxKF domain-containing protein [Gemmatimonadales bacterium]